MLSKLLSEGGYSQCPEGIKRNTSSPVLEHRSIYLSLYFLFFSILLCTFPTISLPYYSPHLSPSSPSLSDDSVIDRTELSPFV